MAGQRKRQQFRAGSKLLVGDTVILTFTAKVQYLVHSWVYRDSDCNKGGCVVEHISDLLLVTILINLELEQHRISQRRPAHIGKQLQVLLLRLCSHSVITHGDGVYMSGRASKSIKKISEDKKESCIRNSDQSAKVVGRWVMG